MIDKILSIGLTPPFNDLCSYHGREFAFRPAARTRGFMEALASQISQQLDTLKVLVVDDEASMRKVTRALLQAIGVRNIFEASDGRKGLDAICARAPDVVILDWEMPSLNGPEFVCAVRSPGRFPYPAVPIIMLTGYSERSRVIEAVRLGVNEYAQAGIVDRDPRPHRLGSRQAAPDDAAGRLLRPGAAQSLQLQAAAGSGFQPGHHGRLRSRIMSAKRLKKNLEDVIESLCVLVVDDNQYTRKMVRNLLVNCGIKDVYEAADGIAALDMIRTLAPDVVILDWEMQLLSGAELVRIVRSPGVFPIPEYPDHHAYRPLRALAGRRGGSARRQRISDQACVGQSAA
jgi:CheY-like chemotaxis protein